GKAVGARLCVNCAPGKPPEWKTVIGVVSSIRHAALDQAPGLEVYLSGDSLASAVFLVVRSARPPEGLTTAIRRVVAAADPNQPVFLSATMSALISDSLSDRRFILTLLGATGLLALLLSAAGVYGVVSYVTSQRTQEIGVRMALGASPRRVHGLVFRQGMGIAGIGIAVGLPAALAIMRLLRTVAADMRAETGLVALAVGLVTSMAALACWIPARRATRIDPVTALRRD
ncbi:MAG TPA: FtsX-like permease family protein, partial [Bryobacteraceae bacterium]|nr:FtsX-like permease family protein [Bryobacteraceae bacterium]